MRMLQNPTTIEREISILYELGVPRFDIENLVYEREKRRAAQRKWH